MLSFSGSLRIFISLDPCDMRAGINTLRAMVGGPLQEDPKCGALFVITNKRRRLLKVLYWDGTGFWLLTKSWRRAPTRGPAPRRKVKPNWRSNPKPLPC